MSTKTESESAIPPVENPREWTARKKTRVTLILGSMVLSYTYLSTSFALSANSLQRQFNASAEVVTLGLSLYVLGFALGPLLMGPLAQTNGKRPVYVVSWIIFTACCFVVSESNNLGSILAFRLLSSIAGASALNNVPASYSDMATPVTYPPFFTCYGFSAFAGPALGGLIGAFVNERAGWRWNLRHQAILVGVVTVISVLFAPETDHPRLKRLHDAKYGVRDPSLPVSEKVKGSLASQLSHKSRSFGNAVVRSIKLPFQWLLTDRVVLVVSIYTSLLYAIIYDFFVIIPLAFVTIRGFQAESIGLIYITLFIGFAMASANYLFIQGAINRRLRAKRGEVMLPPETSLIHSIYGCSLAPVGLFLFAWTVPFTNIHWIVPAIGIVLLCAGSMSAFTSLIPYLVAYGGPSAPSVLAAAGFCRSALAAALPLFTRQMCRGITVQGATSLLGGLALLLTPVPLFLYIHGGKLREQVRQRKEAAAAAEAAAKTDASGPATTKEMGREAPIGARVPPGGTVEREDSHSSADASTAVPESAA
ncbi:Major facilitator superfamily [Kalmanozyma brasiliensis GHG001]|uniref:Major facilitator superfamily n=1 Tax=Kalmanozyma brasiliensis (strain GHG001) TaxID=1365824 RepID=UPI002868137C|nr:Major facilitator superfamily [Kalmanozyma brasiliensis GHG001]EST04881.2 Major facilitator superfamily [Kalmanozyma brasiliensis GHG001]